MNEETRGTGDDSAARGAATPHGTQFVPIAQALGLLSHLIDSRKAFIERIANPGHGPQLLEIRTDRRENARLHQRLWAVLAT